PASPAAVIAAATASPAPIRFHADRGRRVTGRAPKAGRPARVAWGPMPGNVGHDAAGGPPDAGTGEIAPGRGIVPPVRRPPPARRPRGGARPRAAAGRGAGRGAGGVGGSPARSAPSGAEPGGCLGSLAVSAATSAAPPAGTDAGSAGNGCRRWASATCTAG